MPIAPRPVTALRSLLLCLAVLVAGGPAARAADPAPDFRPVALAPLAHQAAMLRVVGPAGAAEYGPQELERFPTYALTTTTPWRDAPARFEGILLADLLAAHGLSGAPAIEVLAENDFATVIERQAMETGAFLIATRVDGAPHSRRARGPIQLVVPDRLYDAPGPLRERHLVWMVKEIRLPAAPGG